MLEIESGTHQLDEICRSRLPISRRIKAAPKQFARVSFTLDYGAFGKTLVYMLSDFQKPKLMAFQIRLMPHCHCIVTAICYTN